MLRGHSVSEPLQAAAEYAERLCQLPTVRSHLGSLRPLLGAKLGADPAAYLLTPTQWEPQRAEFCRLVDKPADPAAALAALTDEWLTAVGELGERVAEVQAHAPHEHRLAVR